MIVGKEEITWISKSYINEDPYGNPIEEEVFKTIENVLVGKDSATVTAGLFGDSTNVDITIYIDPSYEPLINNDAEFIYLGKRYVIVDEPVLWRTFQNSKIKPKLIIGLRHDG